MSFVTSSDLVAKRWPTEDVVLPELDNKLVRVTTFSTATFMRLGELEKQYPGKVFALWFIAACTDDQGNALFTEADVDAVSALPFSVVNRVMTVIKRLNGITDGAEGK